MASSFVLTATSACNNGVLSELSAIFFQKQVEYPLLTSQKKKEKEKDAMNKNHKSKSNFPLIGILPSSWPSLPRRIS